MWLARYTGQRDSGPSGSRPSEVRAWRSLWNILSGNGQEALKLPLSRAFGAGLLFTSRCHEGWCLLYFGKRNSCPQPPGTSCATGADEGGLHLRTLCLCADSLLIPSLTWGIGRDNGLWDQAGLGLNPGSAIHWL